MFQPLTSAFSWSMKRLIEAWERVYLFRYGRDGMEEQPVFIIGAPRCGSTVLYQAITNYFDVLYIDNLACRWRDNLFFGFCLSHKRFGDKPHDNFQADHGNTTAYGDHAPSECGQFWYRWLPTDRHYVADHEITDRMVAGIRREISAISNYFNRPIVFKNLNAGQRLGLIRRCFPGARLIHLRRDHASQVRSIVEARHRVGVGEGEWWSIKPPGYEAMLSMPEQEMVAAQVTGIERQIAVDLEHFPHENRVEVHMDDLSSELVESIGTWLGLKHRPGGTLPEFRREAAGG